MTASSSYYDATNGGYHGPSEARLNNTRVTHANGSYAAGIWAAGAADLNQYIQVALCTVILNKKNCTSWAPASVSMKVSLIRLLDYLIVFYDVMSDKRREFT